MEITIVRGIYRLDTKLKLGGNLTDAQRRELLSPVDCLSMIA
jgi:hypothetical protein